MLRAYLIALVIFSSFSDSGAQMSDRFERFVAGERGLLGDYFFTLAEDDMGFIWVGGQTGLQRFDGQSFKFYGGILTHTYVNRLHVSRDGKIWVATRNGLNLFDPRTEEITHFIHDAADPTSIAHQSTEPILEDRSGTIWIGTYHGLSQYLPSSQTFRNFRKGNQRGFSSEIRYTDIIQNINNDDQLFLASNRGLQVFSISREEFTEIDIPIALNTSYSDSRKPTLLDLYQDPSGSLWMGFAESNDIVQYQPATEAWKKYPVDSRARLTPNRTRGTYDFIPISDHELLISMVPAIGILNTTTEEFTWFDLSEIDQDKALLAAVRRLFIDSRGHLWMPSLRGISRSIDPFILPKKSPDRVFLTDIKINGTSLQQPLAAYRDQLDLTYQQNKIQINFCLPNPTQNRDSVTFAYRLLGQSNSWETTDLGQATFADVHSGSYILEMRAREKGGAWTQTSTLPIQLAGVWWKTGWFRITVAGVLAALLGSLFWFRFRYKENARRMKEKYEKEIAEVQLHALRAQMNPHFLFNTMNSINHFILRNDSDAASDYLTKFSRLVRQILNNSRSQVVRLSDEFEALRLYIELEQLRFEHVFEFDIQIDANIESEKIAIAPLLVQPYVENAIWHGLMPKEGQGHLAVQVSKEGEELIVSVRDNGIGRAAAASHQTAHSNQKSHGMQITKDRVDLVDQFYRSSADIEIIDHTDAAGVASGTEVVITLPLVEVGAP